jgi:hypothetical protein
MMVRLVVLVLVPLLVVAGPPEDVFSSTSEMAALAEMERKLVRQLMDYREMIAKKMEEVRAMKEGNIALVDTEDTAAVPYGLERQLRDLPAGDQITGAAQGVFLLQETYDLDIPTLSRGTVRAPLLSPEPFAAVEGLTSRDTDYLGKVAYNRGFYDRAVQWFQETLHRAEWEGLTANETKVAHYGGILLTVVSGFPQPAEGDNPDP